MQIKNENLIEYNNNSSNKLISKNKELKNYGKPKRGYISAFSLTCIFFVEVMAVQAISKNLGVLIVTGSYELIFCAFALFTIILVRIGQLFLVWMRSTWEGGSCYWILLTLTLPCYIMLGSFCFAYNSFLMRTQFRTGNNYVPQKQQDLHNGLTVQNQFSQIMHTIMYSHYYGGYRLAWDNVQRNYECCGYTSPKDWELVSPRIPASCCSNNNINNNNNYNNIVIKNNNNDYEETDEISDNYRKNPYISASSSSARIFKRNIRLLNNVDYDADYEEKIRHNTCSVKNAYQRGCSDLVYGTLDQYTYTVENSLYVFMIFESLTLLILIIMGLRLRQVNSKPKINKNNKYFPFTISSPSSVAAAVTAASAASAPPAKGGQMGNQLKKFSVPQNFTIL